MRAKKRTAGHANWAVRIVVIGCIVFAFVKIVQIQMQINQKQEEINRLENAIAMAELYNEDLAEQGAHFEEYLEQHLREQGYVYPSDQVYQFSN